MSQVRININTSFSENKSAGIAAKFLNSGEIFLRDGIEIAISCLFAPLGAAVEGASPSAVKKRCEISRMQFETYMNLAMSRAETLTSHPDKVNEIDVTETAETILSDEIDAEETFVVSNYNSQLDDKTLYINFDDEEF